MVSVFVELSLSLNMKLFIAVNLQTGEAYLTDMTRELQQKSQLLEASISVMKSLESADNTIPLMPKPDPVRATVPQLEPHGFFLSLSSLPFRHLYVSYLEILVRPIKSLPII